MELDQGPCLSSPMQQSQRGTPLTSSHDVDGMSLASSHPVGNQQLTPGSNSGGIIPTSRYHVGTNHLATGNHVGTSILYEIPMLKWWR